MIRSLMVPYLYRLGPEELAATIPPIVAPLSGGSMASIWSEPETYSCRSSSFTPAWTDDLVSWRVLQHLVHSCGAYDEVEPARRVADVHLRAAAPGRDGQAIAGGELHYVADLLDGARLDHEVGLDALDGILFRCLVDILRADYPSQILCESFLRLHQNCSTMPAFCRGCMWKGPGRSPQRRGVGKILPGLAN